MPPCLPRRGLIQYCCGLITCLPYACLVNFRFNLVPHPDILPYPIVFYLPSQFQALLIVIVPMGLPYAGGNFGRIMQRLEFTPSPEDPITPAQTRTRASPF